MRRLVSFAALLALTPLLAFGPAERTSPTRWALVVGIGEYAFLEDADLPGAERDARSIRDALVGRWGFPEENVRLLLGEEATRAAIEEGITSWLPSVARPGDLVLFYFAGHGSQVWDETGEEPTGLNQTIAPADVRLLDPSFDIVDKELGGWLADLPSRNVVAILDSCHSGTATRDVTPFSRPRVLRRDLEAMPRPAGVARRALPGQDELEPFSTRVAHVLELASAQPFQVAVDAQFQPPDGSEPYWGGAFTTHFVRQLWTAPTDATYASVFHAAVEAVKRDRFQQDPMITGEGGGTLFFVEGGPGAGRPFTPVLSSSGATVELGGGHALGTTAGSVYELQGGARVVVESVAADRATARLLSGSLPGGGGRTGARLVAHRYVDTPLRVGVAGLDSATRQALEAALAGDAGIALMDAPDAFSHLLVRRSGDEARIVGADGAFRHRFAAGAASADALAGALRLEAAARRLADVENPAPPFEVGVWLAGERSSFGIGELVTFHARSEREGYLTLVDVGTDGQVTVLFPNPYERDNRVRAGQTYTFPSPAMDFEIVAEPPAGRGLVRAFVTERPLDLPLGDDFTAGTGELADRIARAVRAAAGAAPDAPDAVRLESWSGASVSYEIRP